MLSFEIVRSMTTVFVLRTRRERLLELLGLVSVRDAERVQVLFAADLELGHVAGLLDLDSCRGQS